MQTEPDSPFAQFARISSALSAPNRLKLLDRLCQGEQSVEQLAESTGLSVSNTSRQLRILAEAGLAVARREPPFVYYGLASDTVLQFWFALRDLARARLSELDRIAAELVAGKDPVTPMTRDRLIALMEAGEVVLLDVRPRVEFDAGHITGAISIPLDDLKEGWTSLPASRQVVAYCRGPYCVLSVDAVQELRRKGLDAIRLQDGFPEWKAAGLPVEAR